MALKIPDILEIRKIVAIEKNIRDSKHEVYRSRYF